MASGPSQQSNMFQISDILTAPMPQEHKEIVIGHVGRLHNILRELNEDAPARSPEESAARIQLEKLTKIFRSYQDRSQRGEFEDGEVESMMNHLIDECILSTLTEGEWICEFPRGRPRDRYPLPSRDVVPNMDAEEEIADKMAILNLVDANPPAELAEDAFQGIPGRWRLAFDWRDFGAERRVQSEHRSLRDRQIERIITDRPAYTRQLSQRTPEVEYGPWPLTPEEESEYYATGMSGSHNRQS